MSTLYEIYIEIISQIVKFGNRSVWTEKEDIYAQKIANQRKFPILITKNDKMYKRFVPQSDITNI